jgi:two-component system, LytTR family, sensor kinase
VLFYNGNTNCFIPDFWIDVLVTFIYTTIIWHGNRACFILIKNKFNSIHQTRIRLIYLSLIVVLFSTVASIVLDIIFKYFVFAVPVNVPDLGTNIILSIGFSLVVMLIYESAYFFTMWKQAIIAAEELKKVNIQAQFNALKMRVSPHFLFNSLNTLSALI